MSTFTLDPQYSLVPQKLHEALLTLPATESDCATYMRTTGGLTLSQATVIAGIDLIIADLYDQAILSAQTYADLLAKHQMVSEDKAQRIINATGKIVLLKVERDTLQNMIDDAVAQYMALTTAQKNAIADIYTVALEGVDSFSQRVGELDKEINIIDTLRTIY